MMKNPQPEIETLDELAKWWAMPKGVLQTHIAWCYNGFANVADHIDN